MLSRPIDAAGELQRSLDLLMKYWVLAIPSALASLGFAVFLTFVVLSALGGLGASALLSGGGDVSRATAAMLALFSSATFLIGVPVLVILLVLAHVMTIVAAQDAWEGRSPDFARAFNVALGRIPAIIVAAILIALLAIVPIILVIAAGLGLLLILALSFFMMYVTASIMLGGKSGSGAIGESYRIVRANLGPSATAFFAFIVVGIVGSIANSLVAHVPLVNLLGAFVIGGFTTAFSAVVSARFYDLLTGRDAGMLFPGTAAPPPPGSSLIAP